MAFSDRIAQIIVHYNISPKDLAELTGVQRSAISHIINGRNKPSVSFISKLTEAFPRLSTNWLLHGKGNIEIDGKETVVTNVISMEQNQVHENVTNVTGGFSKNVPPEFREMSVSDYEDSASYGPTRSVKKNPHKKLVRVICFYDDGSFESFEQS